MIIDITRAIHESMAIYPGNPVVVVQPVQAAGPATSALTRLILGTHTGTHLDAPAHIDARGAGTATYSLSQLNGPATVLDLTAVSAVVSRRDLPAKLPARVLLKTKNSAGDPDHFDPDFVALDESAAEYLVQQRVRLVGIDGPSIKKRGSQDSVHRQLLAAGIAIVEGLWLGEVKQGDYELICLPLSIDSDGAPVRAVLRS